MHLEHLPGTFVGLSNLVELLLHRARCQPDDTAFTYLVDGEHEHVDLTYRQLDARARAIAAWLESHDLVGERALLLYPAGLEFVSALFGCLYAGVVAVPVYPPRPNRSLDRIQAIVDDAEAKVALTTELVRNRVLPLIDETPHLQQLTWLPTCQVPPDMEHGWSMPDVHGDTLAILQYTSGSTGTPKGVALTHANLMHNSALIAHSLEHSRLDTGVFWLPSYHDMGLIGGILQPLYVGRPNILLSPMSFLQKPYRWLSAISRFGGTTSGGPNFAYDLCVRKVTPEQRQTLDLRTWRVAFTGAEPVRPDVLDAFAETFAPCGFRREAFFPCFGLAEATLIVSGGDVGDLPVVRAFDAAGLARGEVIDADPGAEGVRPLVGCGRNLPDQTIVIADPDSRLPCSSGRIGEIWVRGPSVAQGYWRQPEATERTFNARLHDTNEGPFLRTGDLGFLRDGELFVTSRLKDLIIVHGMNYCPQDIERTVQGSHSWLRVDCGAAFTVETRGCERLVIVQEVERHRRSDVSGVFGAIRRAVAGEHQLAPDAIVLIRAGSVPKTSSGKIQRHACRAGYLAGTLDVVGQWRAAEAPADGESRPIDERLTQLVVDEIRRVARERADGMTLDSPIVETGMDSLERMEILSSLEEKFGGRFREDILPDLETARHVVAAVEKYLGTEPRPGRDRPVDGEIPRAHYRFDLFPEVLRLRTSLDAAAASGLENPFFATHEGTTTDRTTIAGREFIDFSSFNYLGMSGDPMVDAAAKAAIDRYGTSASASRLVSGQKVVHVELERALTRFLGTEDTIVLGAGHATNETVIGHLLGPGDLILHDALAHNSIVQGAILSGARRRPFPHNDWQAVDRLLEQSRHEYRRVLVAVDGVYSMDGDIAPLPRLVEVKQRHKALLLIDEAHSIGVLGSTGRGLAEHFNVDWREVDIWMGTLSKALGAMGGYVSGGKALVEYLRYTVPGFVFATAVPPAMAAAALAALALIDAEPGRLVRLRDNARLFLDLARQHGLNTGTSESTPVVPVILGNSFHCVKLSKAMLDRGVNVRPILHPAVEESASRLRYVISARHSEEQIRYAVEAMVDALN